MKKLNLVWKKTKKKCDATENLLVRSYINFLRKVAETYVKQGRKVYFKENQVVHWGEGNFGHLVIEGTENVYDVFGEYIPEIGFEKKLPKAITKSYKRIGKDNLTEIRYSL